MKSEKEVEAFALKLSVAGYLFMAVLGVTFSILTQSEAIMLDGIYSLVSFVMALLAKRVSKLVEMPDSETFHFGYAHFEPWLNVVRGLLILVICAFAFASAINALAHGGRSLSPDLGVVYGGTASFGCILLAIAQRRFSKKTHSPLLAVDARNWFVDGIISSVVGLTFLAATWLRGTSWAHLIPYVDPVLVIGVEVLLIKIPVVIVWENLKEVLMVAPDLSVQQEIGKKVRTAIADLPWRDVQVRMVKIGRFFYTMVHVVMPSDYSVGAISELDESRRRIGESLNDVGPRLILDTIFTADEKWVAGEVEPR